MKAGEIAKAGGRVSRFVFLKNAMVTDRHYTEAMKTCGSATTFQVSSVAASLRYYVEMLGFAERFQFGDYAGVEHGEVQIHLSGPQAGNKRQVGQGGIYIFCDDVDGYYAELESRGCVAQCAPQDYAYGMRDFVVEDPDGNLVGFGQEIKAEGKE